MLPAAPGSSELCGANVRAENHSGAGARQALSLCWLCWPKAPSSPTWCPEEKCLIARRSSCPRAEAGDDPKAGSAAVWDVLSTPGAPGAHRGMSCAEAQGLVWSRSTALGPCWGGGEGQGGRPLPPWAPGCAWGQDGSAGQSCVRCFTHRVPCLSPGAVSSAFITAPAKPSIFKEAATAHFQSSLYAGSSILPSICCRPAHKTCAEPSSLSFSRAGFGSLYVCPEMRIPGNIY